MILRNLLSMVKDTKIDLYVNGKEVGVYANTESVKEESMYQNYVLTELTTRIIEDNAILVVKVAR